jgi:hypothetical protein
MCKNELHFWNVQKNMSKNYRLYIGSEDQLQKSVAKYLDIIGAVWFHPANERKTKSYINKAGKRVSPEGGRLKAKGVKSGVPDIIIFNQKRGYAGMAIELKVGNNKASPNQKEFMGKMTSLKWFTYISYSLEEIIDLIDWYFSG